VSDPVQATPIDQQTKLQSQAYQGPTLTGTKVGPSQTISGHPEIKAGPVISPEVGEIEVIPESPEISPELAEHVEKVVRGEIQLPGPIEVGKHKGENVTISPFTPQQPNIVLPMTQSDFQQGAKQPTSAAWRWLYEWVRRVILMAPGRTLYRQ